VLLLATGVVDELPPLPGLDRCYGRSVFHCPYCDGWEQRDQPIALYGRGHRGAGLALELTTWSRDLILCTDESDELADRDRDRLARNGIVVEERRIAELCADDGQLSAVRFVDGALLPRRAMFSSPASGNALVWPPPWAVSSTPREPSRPARTSPPTSRDCSSRATHPAEPNSPSSPRPKERTPPRRLTPSCSAKICSSCTERSSSLSGGLDIQFPLRSRVSAVAPTEGWVAKGDSPGAQWWHAATDLRPAAC